MAPQLQHLLQTYARKIPEGKKLQNALGQVLEIKKQTTNRPKTD
jgi:hypothetical protein